MTTALDEITGAMKLLGLLFKGEVPSADEASDGLVTLNDMLSAWSNNNLLTIAYYYENFPLVAGQAAYTMGTGMNFNTVRPINFVTAFIRQGTVDNPIKIITPEEYDLEIPIKNIQGPIPQFMTTDNNYPYNTLTFYPTPSVNYSVYFHTNKPLANIPTLSTTFDMPPGWSKAVKFNLAVDLAPQYGVQVPEEVVYGARESLGLIKQAVSINNGMPYLGNDDGTSYSILTGVY